MEIILVVNKCKNYNKIKWSMWSILTFSFILVLFLRMSTAVISDNMSKELGFNSVQISNIVSMALYAYAFMQIPSGLLIDKYGTRKIASIGIITAGIGAILFGFIQTPILAYISRLMVGAGGSVILLSLFKIQGSWFEKEEFSSATAKFSFIGNLGSVLATFPLVFLNQLIGWRNSFILIGTLTVIAGISIYLIIRNTPADLGFELINDEDEDDEKINILEGLGSVLKNKATWYNSTIMFSLVGISTAFTSLWGISYIMDVYGVSKSMAAFIVSFFAYGFVFGSMIMDFLFKKVKGSKFRIIEIGATINLVIWIFIILICNVKPPIIILPVAFFVIGSINMSHLQAFNDVKYKNKQQYSGVSTSIVNTSEFVGSGLINLLIGFVIMSNNSDMVHGYKYGFMIFIILSVVTIIASRIGLKND